MSARLSFSAVGALPAIEVAQSFGLACDGTGFACPACKATWRGRQDRRLAVGCRGPAWQCHACGAKGDPVTLAAYVVVGRVPAKGDPAWREVIAALEGAGMASDDASSELPRRGVSTPSAGKPSSNETVPPSAEEVRAFWLACREVNEPRNTAGGAGNQLDSAAAAFLERRGYWPPQDIAELDLVRYAPVGAGVWSAWWPRSWSAWWLVARASTPPGVMASIHARAVSPEAESRGKTRWPKGCAARGLLMADALGVAMLRGEVAPEAVVIVEGLTGVLWQALLNRREGRRWAVLGGTSGSWCGLAEVAWPDGVTVFVGTDHDQTGDRYAMDITSAVPRLVDVRRVTFGGEVSFGR